MIIYAPFIIRKRFNNIADTKERMMSAKCPQRSLKVPEIKER